MGLFDFVGDVFGGLQKSMGLTQSGPQQFNIDPNAFQNAGYGENRADASRFMNDAATRQVGAPFRQGQLDLIQNLQMAERGQGPSLASAQLQAGMDRSLSQNAAAMGANRGVNAGLAMRLAGQQAGEANNQLAQQAAMARMQEQMQARGELAQALTQGRGQDISTQGMNDEQIRAMLNSRIGQDEAQRQAAMNQQQMSLNALQGYNSQYGQTQQNNIGTLGKIYGATAQGIAGPAAKVDK